MERVYLHWNIVNWITVVLMAFTGLFLVGLVSNGVKAANGGRTLHSSE